MHVSIYPIKGVSTRRTSYENDQTESIRVVGFVHNQGRQSVSTCHFPVFVYQESILEFTGIGRSVVVVLRDTSPGSQQSQSLSLFEKWQLRDEFRYRFFSCRQT